jgi:hypothetical protein
MNPLDCFVPTPRMVEVDHAARGETARGVGEFEYASGPSMSKVSITSAALAAALTGAAGFAVGRSTSSEPVHAEPTFTQPPQPIEPMGGSGGNDLPPGHPAVGMTGNTADLPPAGEASITWTAPARWKSVANPSSMRLATFKIPHAAGDAEDPDLSVTQVGGGVDANIDRWIGQFDAAGQKSTKKSVKTIKGMKVTIVEIEGAFSGGMGQTGTQSGWALLGAIVETSPMPHFFKMTGPAKSVKAARAELDGMMDTIAPK